MRAHGASCSPKPACSGWKRFARRWHRPRRSFAPRSAPRWPPWWHWGWRRTAPERPPGTGPGVTRAGGLSRNRPLRRGLKWLRRPSRHQPVVRLTVPPQQAARPAAKETRMRILIAEDDQVLADGLLRSLRAAGAAVDHVASGSEADAALMTNNEFDLPVPHPGPPPGGEPRA